MTPKEIRESNLRELEKFRTATALSELAPSDPARPSGSLRCDAMVGAPRRPSKRDAWTRGYVCAIAQHWQQHEDCVTTGDLLRCAGKTEYILKHADDEDIATLRQAGFLAPNTSFARSAENQKP